MSNAELNNELNNSKKTFSRRLLRFGVPVFTAAALTVTVYSVKHETYAAGAVTVHVYTNEYEDKTYHENDTTDEYGKFTEPVVEKLGYELEGWFLNENFSGDPIDFTTHEFLSESNIYAQWSPEQYDLDYVLNGGHYEDDDVTNPAAYTIETETFSLVGLVRDGYTFTGWYDNPDLDGEPVTEIIKGSTGSGAFYAGWSPEQYDLDYVLNGGHYEDDDVTNPAAYTIETETFSLVGLVRDGYTFTGWYDNPDLDGEPVTEIIKGSTGSGAFYAGWTPEQYNIDYELNGGHYADEDKVNPAAYTIESDTITLVDLVRDGYTFSGWYDNPEFNGEPVTVINAGSTGNMTLYAAWTPVNNTGSSDSSSTSDSSVKTGDSNNVIVYGCLAAVAAGGVVLAIGLKKKSAK